MTNFLLALIALMLGLYLFPVAVVGAVALLLAICILRTIHWFIFDVVLWKMPAHWMEPEKVSGSATGSK